MKVVVFSQHPICDDEGHELSPWQEYDIDEGPVVDELISNGLLKVLENPPVALEEEPAKVETKKSALNKSNRTQATVADETQENSDG